MPKDLAPYGYLDGVNRSVVIITPKAPYLEWARSVCAHEKEPPTDLPAQSVALLVPELDEEVEDAVEHVRAVCGDVFKHLLASWHRDMATWPPGSESWGLFTTWFEIRTAEQVFDLDFDQDLIHDSDDAG